jgi:hypothetical protein
MSTYETEPGRRPALPLAVPIALALTVWVAALLWRTDVPQRTSSPPKIVTGTATDLAPAIKAAPRAIVYVGCPVTTQSVHGRRLFDAALPELAASGKSPRLQFFVIEDEGADDAIAWASGFRDMRLALFGCLGDGWVFWLERGQLREVDPYSGVHTRTSPLELVERTQKVWP